VRNRLVREALAAVVLAALTVGGWSALLGWDEKKHLDANGTLSGPYEEWQVICLGAILIVAVAAVARLGHWPATLVVPVALTVCFSIAGITDPNGDGLWPVGAGFLFVVSFPATFLLAAWVAGLFRRRS